MNPLGEDLAAALDPVTFAGATAWEPEPWQGGLMRSTSRRVLVSCARQVGKTETTARKAMHVARYWPGSLVLIFSPSQRQSDELLLRVKAVHRALELPRPKKSNDSELELENGSRVVSLPGTEATTRGFAGARLLILDEAARIPDDIFHAVLPMVASEGQMFALSTPWGKRGWFYDLHLDETNGWERHRVTVHESAQWSERRIAEVRASVGSFIWSSDYLAEFGDSSSSVFSSEVVAGMFTPAVAPLDLGEVA